RKNSFAKRFDDAQLKQNRRVKLTGGETFGRRSAFRPLAMFWRGLLGLNLLGRRKTDWPGQSCCLWVCYLPLQQKRRRLRSREMMADPRDLRRRNRKQLSPRRP